MITRSRVLLLLALVLPLWLGACGGGGPSGVVKRFTTSVAEGRLEVAVELFSSRTREMFGDEKMRAQLVNGSENVQESGGLAKIEILNEAIDESGVQATVRARAAYRNGETDISDFLLVRESGEWKIEVSAK